MFEVFIGAVIMLVGIVIGSALPGAKKTDDKK